MAITIEREYNVLKVKVNEPGFGRYTVIATTTEEAALCVSHYFGGNGRHLGEEKNCPFCRRCLEIAAKHNRKRKPKGV